MKRTEYDLLFVILGMAMVLAPSFLGISGVFQYALFVGGVLVAAYSREIAAKIGRGK